MKAARRGSQLGSAAPPGGNSRPNAPEEEQSLPAAFSGGSSLSVSLPVVTARRDGRRAGRPPAVAAGDRRGRGSVALQAFTALASDVASGEKRRHLKKALRTFKGGRRRKEAIAIYQRQPG